MKKSIIFITALIMMIGCGSKTTSDTVCETSVPNDGDKTIYGMACDGCNDTILVYLTLPYDGEDPDTLYILDAYKNHRVIGTPHIGDKLAIMRCEDDSTCAETVIVLEQLMGDWCYQVKPEWKQRADFEGETTQQQLNNLPDSILELLSVPHEYCYSIRSDNMLFTMGMRHTSPTSDEKMSIEYPEQKFYNEWTIFNGHLVLSDCHKDSLGQRIVEASDTVELLMLDADTLMLHFSDGIRGFYRKAEESKE